MMWLNRNFFFITTGLVVLMLFISSSVATNKRCNNHKHYKHCDTVIKAHHYTRTVYPSHCPKIQTKTTTTTSTATAITATTTTSITTTTTTTTSTSTTFVEPGFTPQPILKKRHQQNKHKTFTCVPDKHKHYIHDKHGKCKEITYCTPTVYKPCPKDKTTTKTIFETTTSTSTATTTSTSTSTTTSVLVIPTCRASGTFCDLSNFTTCCTQCCRISDPSGNPINQCC
jgi:hypothetical protein